jgi:transposase
MPEEKADPKRFIGLDIHKHYLIATGLDAGLHQVYGPQRVQLTYLEAWIQKTLTPEDAVALEMTTNTWQVYDELMPHVHSIIVVHPPHVKLITKAQVMTDKIAALTLAKHLAKGLLVGIWIPPQGVRDHRALVAQRAKMIRLATQAKNRLHAVLQRYHLLPPEGALFDPEQRPWWLALPVSSIEKIRIQSDLDTLAFAQEQIDYLEEGWAALVAPDERLTLLVQLPGVGWRTAAIILAAIGVIERFPDPKHLVGYSGLGGRVHDSGQTTRTGGITKSGRRDLRAAMVESAQAAANTHPYWQAELARLEPRLGRNKAIVAIARKLLVAVWYVLTEGVADRHAEPERTARKLLKVAYDLGAENRPEGVPAAVVVRQQLDRLGLGQDLTHIARGTKKRPVSLPPSSLPPAGD